MAQAGWYESPGEQGMLRYWDGAAWTDHRQPVPPIGAPAAVPAQPAIVPNNEVERMLLQLRDYSASEHARLAADPSATPRLPEVVNAGDPNSSGGIGFSLNMGSLGPLGKAMFVGLLLVLGGFMYMGMARPASPSGFEAFIEQYSWGIPLLGAVVFLISFVLYFRQTGTFFSDARVIIDKLRGRDSA